MAATLSLALGTTPSGFGMQALVSVWQVHSRVTQVQSTLLLIHQMASTLLLDPGIILSKCGVFNSLILLVLYMQKIAGFNLLMVLALVGWLHGIVITFISPFILW